MKPRAFPTLVAAGFLIAAATATANAQAIPGKVDTPLMSSVNVDFAFTAAAKALPAGRYEVTSPVPGMVVFRDAAAKLTVEAPVITRLAKARDYTEANTADTPRLVFDKVGDKFVVSEVWFPDADGFLIGSTKEAHTHRVVKTPKA